MLLAYLMITGAGLALWVPLFLRFYKSWALRGNPVSLGICACIGQLAWIGVSGIWQLLGDADHDAILLITATLSLAVALYCHRAFVVAEQRLGPLDKKERKT